VGWFKLIGSKVLVGTLPSWSNFVCRAIWFFYDHLLASLDLHLPAPFPKERASHSMNLVGPSRNIIYFIYILFVGDFSFIRGCRKHECIRFKINRACFYCFLGLEIIGYSNKSLWIRPSLHMLTRFHSTADL